MGETEVRSKNACKFKKAEERIPKIDVYETSDGLVAAPFHTRSTYMRKGKYICSPLFPLPTRMKKAVYYNSEEDPRLIFRPATTAESLRILSEAPRIVGEYSPSPESPWSLGWVAKTEGGVYFNPPLDKVFGRKDPDYKSRWNITRKTLRECLSKAEEVGGIQMVPNGSVAGLRDFSYVPYRLIDEKLQSRLARGIEHSLEGRPKHLRRIASASTREPKLKLASLELPEEEIGIHVEFMGLVNLDPLELVFNLGDRTFYAGPGAWGSRFHFIGVAKKDVKDER